MTTEEFTVTLKQLTQLIHKSVFSNQGVISKDVLESVYAISLVIGCSNSAILRRISLIIP